MADEMMRELAPLLAEEGVDFDHPERYDLATLNAALARATERRNMLLFSPVGRARELAVEALRIAVDTILLGETAIATAVIDRIVPESPDGSEATVSSCIGVSLGLLDEWLAVGEVGGRDRGSRDHGSRDTDAPRGLAAATRLPAGHWFGERAGTDILALARKGRAFDALGAVIFRHGGKHVLYGSILALAGAVQAWADATDTPFNEVTRSAVR
jgi:hypothetical protein